MEHYLLLLSNSITEYSGFKDACILVSVWLRQRGFDTTIQGGGFGSFESAAMIALLIKNKGKNGIPIFFSGLGGHALFRVFLQFLASRDLVNEPFAFDKHLLNETPLCLLQGPAFFDDELHHNLLFKMTPWSYAKVCR